MNVLIEDNFRNLCVKFADVSKGEFVNSEYYNYVTNCYNRWYCRILDIRIPDSKFRDVIDQIKKDVKVGKIPNYLITGPGSLPGNIHELLPQYGFYLFYSQTGMAVELQHLDIKRSVGNYEICIADKECELDEWVETANKAFGKERNAKLFHLLLDDPEITFYYIRLEGRIAATIMLYKRKSIAGIHFVGTLNEFRGRGLASELTSHALHEAKKSGCETAVLQASDMGKAVYEKIGFKGYGRLYHWEYQF